MEKLKLRKKGQLKIQEMAFVLLAFALLALIVLVFFIRLQSGKLVETAELLKQQRALSLRDRIAALPELSCGGKGCVGIDKDKAELLSAYDLENLFYGLTKARIIEIWPGEKEIIIYDSGKAGNESYSTFVNLCEVKKIGYTFGKECSLALLVVST